MSTEPKPATGDKFDENLASARRDALFYKPKPATGEWTAHHRSELLQALSQHPKDEVENTLSGGVESRHAESGRLFPVLNPILPKEEEIHDSPRERLPNDLGSGSSAPPAQTFWTANMVGMHYVNGQIQTRQLVDDINAALAAERERMEALLEKSRQDGWYEGRDFERKLIQEEQAAAMNTEWMRCLPRLEGDHE
jgi:hypothetical protein